MLYQLECGYQNYDWGKLGDTSLVAQFAKSVGSATIDESAPYAELWMGTHPKVPSHTVGAGSDNKHTHESLRQVLADAPQELGDKVAAEFGAGELPFLFKVLSIRKALSIQAHPDKSLAKILFKRDPKNYPDDNHKPEMAIALTDFEGFCGFRPLAEIAGFLQTVPEFGALVGEEPKKTFEAKWQTDPKGALKALFGAVMEASDAQIGTLAPQLTARAASEGAKFGGGESAGAGKPLADLLVRVNDQFPKDVGLFCGGLMLNYVTLAKGEAMFLRAKDVHAYISGDIIECMAASDNVVRSGFTPKFKDVPTLVDMLTYDSGSVTDQKMVPKSFPEVKGGKQQLFNPPIDEFAVLQQTTPAGTEANVSELASASIFIVTEGSGSIAVNGNELPYKAGFVFFAGAGTPFAIKADAQTVTYHALTELP